MSEPIRVNQQQGVAGNVHATGTAADGNITIGSPPATLDGETLVADEKYLLTQQTNAVENGVWKFVGGALVRPIEDENLKSGYAEKLLGTTVFVRKGTLFGGKEFILADSDSTAIDGYENHVLTIDTHTQVYKPTEAEKVCNTVVDLGSGTIIDDDGNTVAAGGGATTYDIVMNFSSLPVFDGAGNVASGAAPLDWAFYDGTGGSGSVLFSAQSPPAGSDFSDITGLQAHINTNVDASDATVTYVGNILTISFATPPAVSGTPLVSLLDSAPGSGVGQISGSSAEDVQTVSGGSGSIIIGAIDGTNKDFIVDPLQVTVKDIIGLFENGNFEGDSFTYDPATQTITTDDAPQPGDRFELSFDFIV